MKWTEPKPPTVGICYYDHVDCDTPLGLIRIEWKSCKESPSYDIEIKDVWIGCEYSLYNAKLLARHYLENLSKELNEFLTP